jgi:maleylacetate reductase
MHAFTHNALPGRIVFGSGRVAELADEARRLQLRRVLILSTPGQRALADAMAQQLGELAVGVHANAVMHVPDTIARAAVEQARALQADGIVAVGGGSTIGLAKAIALDTGLPSIAIPTTYAGSEMTPIWGITRDGVKATGRDTRVLPRTVIYDAELSQNLPPMISVTSGINAIAHCVEALYAQDANPVSSMMAAEGIRAFAVALPGIVAKPDDMAARGLALYGAWLAGSVLGTVGMALHHKICHTLGGSFNLPHAEVHTVMIPQVTAFNRDAAPEAMMRIAGALGSDDAATGLYELIQRLRAPCSLRELGMPAEDLDLAADLATRNPYYNPRRVTRDNVRALLQSAFDGRSPS